jgi:hypothetical protein
VTRKRPTGQWRPSNVASFANPMGHQRISIQMSKHSPGI